MTTTRRNFVKGAAGALAVGSIAAAALAEEQGADQVQWDYEADVVVVGAGAAGWGACLEATKAGASVIQLEKAGVVGGDMALNAGIHPGYDTPYAREHGVEQTCDDMYEEYLGQVDPLGTPPAEIVKYVIYNSSEFIDIMAENGVEWEKMGLQEWYSSYPVFFQAHNGDLVGGASYREPMAAALESYGVQTLVSTRGRELVVDGSGRVIGVVATGPDGDIAVKGSRAVVLATGGYSSNSALISTFAEQYQGMGSAASHFNMGDGLRMATSLGALTARTDFGGFVQPNSEFGTGLGVTADCLYSGMIVDPTGVRCIDDGASYATTDLTDQFSAQFAKQDDNFLWLVLDSSPDIVEYYETEVSLYNPSFITADTLEELAEAMEVDPTTLVETAATYSQYARDGVDPDFGRTNSLHVVEQGPFHALKIAPAIVMTTGGLKADPECRVVRMAPVGEFDDATAAAGGGTLEAIPGLFAAGQLVEWCCFTGWSCVSCFALGRLAGQMAAAEEPWE